MPIRRQVFRIEEMISTGRATAVAGAAKTSPRPHQRAHGEVDTSRTADARQPDRAFRADAIGAIGLRQLKDDTDTIHRAIIRTRQEIAALHASGLGGLENGRVFRELDAVAGGTERATQQILTAAEEIDEAANNLSALLKRGQQQALAQDIRDQVIRVFEACNFQDLAGQRIATVIATLKFVEDHVTRMMEIWGGIAPFQDHTPAAAPQRACAHENVAANGPRLDGDSGHATQAEIDALFAEQRVANSK